MNRTNSSNINLGTLQTAGIAVGIIGIIAALVGGISNLDRFFQIYLVSYIFVAELTLGCLGFLLLLYLVDGRWGFIVQRIMAAGARVMPLIAVLTLPLLFTAARLYPWAGEHADHGEGYATFHSMGFLVVRVVLYFAVWVGFSYFLTRRSYDSDQGDFSAYPNTQRWAAVGMLLFVVTATLFTMDFVMSITDGWFSTITGWLSITRGAILAMTVALLILSQVWGDKRVGKLLNTRAWLDLSTLMLVTIMAWAYMGWMQYFIMWNGNQPSKIKWFDPRVTGSWEGYTLFIVLGHAIPLLLLLTPGLKRIRPAMLLIALWLVVMRIVDIYWIIMPSYGDLSIAWYDFVLPVAFLGLWVAMFAWSYSANAPIPLNHPPLKELQEADAHHAAKAS